MNSFLSSAAETAQGGTLQYQVARPLDRLPHSAALMFQPVDRMRYVLFTGSFLVQACTGDLFPFWSLSHGLISTSCVCESICSMCKLRCFFSFPNVHKIQIKC